MRLCDGPLKVHPCSALGALQVVTATVSVYAQEGEATVFVYTCDDNDSPNTDSLIHYKFAGFNWRTEGEDHEENVWSLQLSGHFTCLCRAAGFGNYSCLSAGGLGDPVWRWRRQEA